MSFLAVGLGPKKKQKKVGGVLGFVARNESV
jgi:hypothetical protein